MCRRQFLQQQNSSQTAEELARAEVDAQAVISHLREVGRFMHMRGGGQPLRHLDPLEAHIQYLTRNHSVQDEPSLNSGMYS